MTISKQITPLEHSSVRLTLTIGKDEVRSQYDGIVGGYSKTLQIPGFRKGKVPRDVLIRKFAEALKGEALQKTIEEALQEVFEDESFPKESRPLPYSTPKIEEEPKLDLDSDLSFSVTYDVFPKVTLGTWQGLEAEVPDVAVTEEDISRELEVIRERNAVVLDKAEGEEAAPGDVATVNYCELKEDGEVLPGTEREDFVFTLGSGSNYFKFDDEVQGMKAGETKDFEKSFPEDEAARDLAGKTKKLRVTLKALKVKKLPELDDELAQDVDEKYATLEDLKRSIREKLEKDLERRLKELKINRILEKIMETTPVDIPESMMRLELDSRWRNMARNLGTDSEGLYKMMDRMGNGGEASRKMLETWRPGAEKSIHSRIIVEAIMEDQHIEAADDELEGEMQKQSEENGLGLEEVKKYYDSEEGREMLRDEIKDRKLFDKLLEVNTVKTGKKQKYLDFMSRKQVD